MGDVKEGFTVRPDLTLHFIYFVLILFLTLRR